YARSKSGSPSYAADSRRAGWCSNAARTVWFAQALCRSCSARVFMCPPSRAGWEWNRTTGRAGGMREVAGLFDVEALVALDLAARQGGNAVRQLPGALHQWAELPGHRLFEHFCGLARNRSFVCHDPGAREEPEVVGARSAVELAVDFANEVGFFAENDIGEGLRRARDERVAVYHSPERCHQPAVDVLGDPWLAAEQWHSWWASLADLTTG